MKKSLIALSAMSAAVAVAATVVAEAAPKVPSKKSLALVIFQAKLVEREQGLYASNKEFRAAVLSSIEADLGVTTASAATMYNAAKKDAEAAGSVTLGRDPKKAKTPSTGKRGRPAGSKNKDKEAEPVAAEPVAAEPVAQMADALM
jgi:hypothetical protein